MALNLTRRSALITASSFAAGVFLPGSTWSQPSEGNRGDLVVLLPGIAGTVLTAHGRTAWSPSLKGIASAILTLGGSLHQLRLADGAGDSEDAGDGVRAEQLVNDIHLLPGLWRIDGYTQLIRSLSALPGITPGKNFFTFPYDWRKDNRIAARQLARRSHAWLNAWRTESGNRDAKLILVAHSMGGLVSRYFLECLEGWKTTRKLITFGTPFRGSLNALNVLHGGVRIGPVQLDGISTMLRSFPSVYQLLPTYPCIADNDVLRRISDMGSVAHIDPVRVLAAMKFHQEIEDAVRENGRNESYVRQGYQIHPIVGVFQKTKQFARNDNSRLSLLDSFPGKESDGDGTVPRPSATPLELGGRDTEMFLSENHGSLQNSEVGRAHLAGLLSGAGIDWNAYRSRTGGKVSLAVPDVTATGSRITLTGEFDPDVYHHQVKLTMTELYSGRQVFQKTVMGNEAGLFSTSAPALRAGAYRVIAVFTSSRRPASSVSDVIAILQASALS